MGDDESAVDIIEMLRSSSLSSDDRRHVYDALINSVIEGWTPTRDSVQRLIDFAAGRIDIDEYKVHVLNARC